MENTSSPAKRYIKFAHRMSAECLVDHQDVTMAQEGKLRIAYAPFDHIQTDAKLVIVGITPGQQQAVNAWRALQASLESGASNEQALAQAKQVGSFSGALRSNLVSMLDAIGVPDLLGCKTTKTMFETGSGDVHFTSALRYPVFYDGQNYSGTPKLLKSPLLRRHLEEYLVEEAEALQTALWLPLGPVPAEALNHLVEKRILHPNRILSGLPHPSGANAERIAVFLGRKAPELASNKTNPDKLLAAKQALRSQINSLKGEIA